MTEVFSEELVNGLGDPEDHSEESSEAGEWVRKSVAATRLGVTERTIDNRLSQGKLQKRVQKDGSVEVLVAKSTQDDRTEKALFLIERYNQSVAQQIVPLLEQNRELIDQVTKQAEEIGRLKAKVDEFEKGREIQAKPWWRFWG